MKTFLIKTVRTTTATVAIAALLSLGSPLGSLAVAHASAPVNPTTLSATAVTASDATLNGMNGGTDASDSSFWVSTSTFSTPTNGTPIPSGVYSTAVLGSQASSTAFSAPLSSVMGLPAIMPNTMYYYSAWTEVDGTWSAGSVMSVMTATATAPTVTAVTPATGSTAGGTVVTITGMGFTGATVVDFGTLAATSFVVNSDSSITATSPATSTEGVVDVMVTTPVGTSAASADVDQFTYSASSGSIGGTVTGGPSVLTVTSITPVQTNGTSDNTYTRGWSYLFNITMPTNESNLSMEFSNWLASDTNMIPVAGNMQLSSAQASSTAPVTLNAANAFSSPALHMVSDLSTTTPGLQVQVLVQVKIPLNTENDSYTTSYGVQTLP